jgi:glycerate-2-kinase
MRKTAEHIFMAGVKAVMPDALIQSQVFLSEGILTICGDDYTLDSFNNIYLLGAGKASALMALEIEQVLGDWIRGGIIVTKYGHGCSLKYVECIEAAHPVPDANSFAAAESILAIAEQATNNDLVICLLSGGASSLMADLPDELSAADIQQTNALLVTSGATIAEINTVRKHLSKLKGGQLAQAVFPAHCISLILSDVVGDRSEVIASGPTTPDTTRFEDAFSVIQRYRLTDILPEAVISRIKKGMAGEIGETPDTTHPCFSRVNNYIIGNNRRALEASAREAIQRGFDTTIVTDSLEKEYQLVARYLLDQINQAPPTEKPVCLLFGGEPTVKVSGPGKGGRNQHLALYLATLLAEGKWTQNRPDFNQPADGNFTNQLSFPGNITILCAGTDGTDGPTDAAGAVVDAHSLQEALKRDNAPQNYLDNADSYRFFETYGGHILTGNTQTNVMDIIIILYNYPL